MIGYKKHIKKIDGIIFNPAAYTHTSIAIADAVRAIYPLPVIEVHLSKIDEREDYRKVSYVKKYCYKQIFGKGLAVYQEALDLLLLL